MSEYIDVFKRTEIKYYLTSEKYKMLRDFLSEYARVDDYGKTRINNIYFDTPDYRMIRTSLDKPVYKEKLRLRTYGETNDLTNAFIEIKKKYDGIVYKRRVAGPYRRAYDYLINGGRPLKGTNVLATDLRAGAAVVLAGLVAEGVTEVSQIYHIERGYENFVEKITNLGGIIKRVDD